MFIGNLLSFKDVQKLFQDFFQICFVVAKVSVWVTPAAKLCKVFCTSF